MIPTWVQVIVAALLVIGSAFVLIGVIGMLRFPDFYMRLHAPTKASTLGVGAVLAASMVHGWALGRLGLYEVLIMAFLLLTAPVSANLLAKAALHLRVRSKAPLPPGLPYD